MYRLCPGAKKGGGTGAQYHRTAVSLGPAVTTDTAPEVSTIGRHTIGDSRRIGQLVNSLVSCLYYEGVPPTYIGSQAVGMAENFLVL